jgi:hypothetical protein
VLDVSKDRTSSVFRVSSYIPQFLKVKALRSFEAPGNFQGHNVAVQKA